MAFATDFAHQDSVARINITPLVDVMLVLQVIFMIATPLLTRRIAMDLPGNAPVSKHIELPPIRLRIDAAGQLYWNDTPTPASALQAMLDAEHQRDGAAAPALEIDASGEADYGGVARVLAAADNTDWPKVGFVRH